MNKMTNQEVLRASQGADSNLLELSSTELHRVAGGNTCSNYILCDELVIYGVRSTGGRNSKVQLGDGLNLF